MTYDEWLETPYYENDGKEEYSYPVDPDAAMEQKQERKEQEERERSW